MEFSGSEAGLDRIKVRPIADETMGVRSMCTYVETPDISILFDAGVSLAPNRFGLHPHPLEFKALKQARERIQRYAARSDIVTVTHYHFDHLTPAFKSWLEWTTWETQEEIYADKIVLAKDPLEGLGFNQRSRALAFRKNIEKFVYELTYFDGGKKRLGNTVVAASDPVSHGSEGTPLGYLLMFKVEHEGEKIMFCSDVQGPMSNHTLQIILDEKPGLAIIAGPPTYLSGSRADPEEIKKGLRNLCNIASKSHVIVSHHLLRDKDWQEKIIEVCGNRTEGVRKTVTAAKYLHLEDSLLESVRDQMYNDNPPTEEYRSWIKKFEKGLRSDPPPI